MKLKIVLFLILVLIISGFVSALSPTPKTVCCESFLRNESLPDSCNKYNLTLDLCEENLKEWDKAIEEWRQYEDSYRKENYISDNSSPEILEKDAYNYSVSNFYGYIAVGILIILIGLIIWYFIRKGK